MRSTFLVVLLAACAPHAASGPSWPRPTTSAIDGGESLAPHESRQVAVAVEESEPEAKPVAAAAVTTPPPAATTAGAPAVTPTLTPQSTEDPLTVDDIIIEIDE